MPPAGAPRLPGLLALLAWPHYSFCSATLLKAISLKQLITLSSLDSDIEGYGRTCLASSWARRTARSVASWMLNSEHSETPDARCCTSQNKPTPDSHPAVCSPMQFRYVMLCYAVFAVLLALCYVTLCCITSSSDSPELRLPVLHAVGPADPRRDNEAKLPEGVNSHELT